MIQDQYFYYAGGASGVADGGSGGTTPPISPGCTLTLPDPLGDPIPFTVSVEGYRKGYGDRGPWRKITYFVRWDRSDRFIDLLKGGAAAVVGGTTIGFPTPHRYPGNPQLVCVNADGLPHGSPRNDTEKLFAATHCWVACDYEVPVLDVYGEQFSREFDGDTIPWASISERSAEEMVAVPTTDLVTGASHFRYRGRSGGPTQGQIAVPVSGTIVEVRRGMIPGTLSPQFLDLLVSLEGGLNDKVFCGYPRGRLRLDNWSRDFRFDATGAVTWEYAVNFRRRQVDHNAEIVEGTLDEWAIVETPDGDTVSRYVDFDAIKRFGVA